MFYRNRMHADYKKDEAIIRLIINQNVTVTDPKSEISLIIYYQNKRTSQLLMNNSPLACSDPLKKHGVVYQITCPANGCNHSYIGMTTTKLWKRLSVHLQEGNFHQHYIRSHGDLRRPLLLESAQILDQDRSRRRLRLKEALYIMKLKPSLNVTQEDLILPANISRQRPTRNEAQTAGIPVRAPPPPERGREDVGANQRPGIPQPAIPNPVQDPIPVLRRSSRIHHLASTQRPMGIQHSHWPMTSMTPPGYINWPPVIKIHHCNLPHIANTLVNVCVSWPKRRENKFLWSIIVSTS